MFSGLLHPSPEAKESPGVGLPMVLMSGKPVSWVTGAVLKTDEKHWGAPDVFGVKTPQINYILQFVIHFTQVPSLTL